jgi:hypothetical protein
MDMQIFSPKKLVRQRIKWFGLGNGNVTINKTEILNHESLLLLTGFGFKLTSVQGLVFTLQNRRQLHSKAT